MARQSLPRSCGGSSARRLRGDKWGTLYQSWWTERFGLGDLSAEELAAELESATDESVSPEDIGEIADEIASRIVNAYRQKFGQRLRLELGRKRSRGGRTRTCNGWGNGWRLSGYRCILPSRAIQKGSTMRRPHG